MVLHSVRSYCIAIIAFFLLAPIAVVGALLFDQHLSQPQRLKAQLEENVDIRARAAKAHTPPVISLDGLSGEEIAKRYEFDNDGNVMIHGTPYAFRANEKTLLRIDDAY